MADIERVITGLRYCSETPEWNCDKQCPYGDNGKKEAGACWVELNRDALAILKEQEAVIRQLRLALDIAKGTCKGITIEGR